MGEVIPFFLGRGRASVANPRGQSNADKDTSKVPSADIAPELAAIKTELKWIKGTAIVAVSVALPALDWLFFQYVPKKILSGKTELKSELGERIAKVEDGVDRLGRDIQRLESEIKQAKAAFDQLRLKPSELRKLPASEISRKFDEVIGLIDNGLAQKKPPPSMSLAGDKRVVIQVLEEPRLKGEIRGKGLALIARLDAYEAFAKATAAQRPDLLFSNDTFSAPKLSAPFPQTSLLQVRPADSALVVVFKSSFIGGGQDLTNIKWVDVQFKDSVLYYNGGPLYLSDVTFTNCELVFVGDAIAQRLRQTIEESHGRKISAVVSPEYSFQGPSEIH